MDIQVSIEEVATATGIPVEGWGVAAGTLASLWDDGTLQCNSEHGVLVLAQPFGEPSPAIVALSRLHAHKVSA